MRERRMRNLEKESAKKNRIRFLILYLLSVFVILACIGSNMIVKANVGGMDRSYKYYTEVRVHRDDTLWGIADQYITSEYESMSRYIADVKEINSLYTDELRYGQRIMVPYYSDELK